MQTPSGPATRSLQNLSRTDKMHIAMCIAHGLGGLVTLIMTLPCDVAQANQRAMIPRAIPVPLSMFNISATRAYLAAFPWSEDTVFTTHVWNPYVLVASFEWLTAGFALCNLWHLTTHIQMITLAWMITGAAGTVIWFCVNSRRWSDMCTAMGLTLALSYTVTTWLCLSFITEKNVDRSPTHTPEHEPLLPHEENGPPTVNPDPYAEDPEAQEQPLTVRSRIVMEKGRPW